MAEPGMPADVGRLVAEHHGAVYRYAFRLTGRQADAEDLTQQAFLVAIQKGDQIRDPEKARSWLLAVLRSCFLKSYRRKLPIPSTVLDLELDGIAEANRLADDEPIDLDQLQAALDELPEEFRVVLLMFYLDELSYREIAAELGIPSGTVMSRLSRAKGHLRKRLLPLTDEPTENSPAEERRAKRVKTGA